MVEKMEVGKKPRLPSEIHRFLNFGGSHGCFFGNEKLVRAKVASGYTSHSVVHPYVSSEEQGDRDRLIHDEAASKYAKDTQKHALTDSQSQNFLHDAGLRGGLHLLPISSERAFHRAALYANDKTPGQMKFCTKHRNFNELVSSHYGDFHKHENLWEKIKEVSGSQRSEQWLADQFVYRMQAVAKKRELGPDFHLRDARVFFGPNGAFIHAILAAGKPSRERVEKQVHVVQSFGTGAVDRDAERYCSHFEKLVSSDPNYAKLVGKMICLHSPKKLTKYKIPKSSKLAARRAGAR
ncbi:hypothetical protein AUJ65_04675 [Candidatus Micrarchaeota archaeon CG1_02_51_15]|nr:MAG: hypothetical protein AUJ65_04675 [Candidatus Micrarchaeota archaeon CG1_02_51_15]